MNFGSKAIVKLAAVSDNRLMKSLYRRHVSARDHQPRRLTRVHGIPWGNQAVQISLAVSDSEIRACHLVIRELGNQLRPSGFGPSAADGEG